jgi:hypothetical protein
MALVSTNVEETAHTPLTRHSCGGERLDLYGVAVVIWYCPTRALKPLHDY